MPDTTSLEADLGAFRADIAARLARLRPADTIKGLFVRRYLETTARLGGAALRERCLQELGEQRVVDLFNYPYAAMLRMGLATADVLALRAGGVAPWLREIGRNATGAYFDSRLGRAFLAVVQPSPRAMLSMMPWAIRTCFSFGERSVVFDGHCRGLFRCRFEFSPGEANAGAVEAAVQATGAADVQVVVRPFDAFNYDLEVTWREAPGPA